jgi:hypothetical protein
LTARLGTGGPGVVYLGEVDGVDFPVMEPENRDIPKGEIKCAHTEAG